MDPRAQNVQHGSSALPSLLTLSSPDTPARVLATHALGFFPLREALACLSGSRISVLTQSLICFLSLDKPSLLLGLVFLDAVESVKGLCSLWESEIERPLERKPQGQGLLSVLFCLLSPL